MNDKSSLFKVLDPWNENCPDDEPAGNNCAFQRFVALKEINPDLKVIVAVGGWNEGSEDYSNVSIYFIKCLPLMHVSLNIEHYIVEITTA